MNAAHALVAVFFQRRKVVIDRQKALQAGKEDLADELDDQIEDLEKKEAAAREAYPKAAAAGAASNVADASAAVSATAPAKGSSVYGAAFDNAPAARAPISEDDFI